MITNTRQTERIEKQGEIKFRDYSTAKSLEGWILGRISKFSKQGNIEMQLIFQEFLNAYKYYHPSEEKTPKVIEITLEGWKGDGQIDIYKGFTNDFIVVEHIKDKESEKVDEVKHEVSKVNVNRLLFIIKKWNINESHSCYEVADMLGFDWQDLWANRVKDYFPKYYYPIKVLEKIGVINYGGRGNVTRVK